MFMYWVRRFLVLALVAVIIAGVAFYIRREESIRVREELNYRTTLAIETAIARALFEATRTAEADLRQYRLVRLGDGEPLLDVALRYNTTVEVLRMANKLLPNVDSGSGETIIVPEGVQELEPPRSLRTHTALDGDTLSSLAALFDVPLELLEEDNPVLAGRGVTPGDIIFVPELL